MLILYSREGVRRMSVRLGGGGGNIVNVSIGACCGPRGEYVDYAATRGAVGTLIIGLPREVAEEGIRVNGVWPGTAANRREVAAAILRASHANQRFFARGAVRAASPAMKR